MRSAKMDPSTLATTEQTMRRRPGMLYWLRIFTMSTIV